MNTAAVISLLLAVIDRVTAIGALLVKARAENRDITDEEFAALIAADNSAREQLVDAITDAKAQAVADAGG
jgi:hypothetical protein